MNSMNRRSFLQQSALATAALNILPAAGFAAEATDKLKLGLIGCGWYGMVDVEAAFKVGGVEVVALCDVDSDNLSKSAARVEKLQGQRPKTFKHYEDLLKEDGLRGGDHCHAAALARAAVHRRAGARPGHLLREAAGLRHPRRPGDGGRGAEGRAHRADRLPAAAEPGHPGRCAITSSKAVAGQIIQVEAQIHYRRRHEGRHAAESSRQPGLGSVVRPRAQAALFAATSGISPGGWRRNTVTVIWWTGAFISLTPRVTFSVRPRPKSVQAAGGIYYFKNKITTPDVLDRPFRFREMSRWSGGIACTGRRNTPRKSRTESRPQ